MVCTEVGAGSTESNLPFFEDLGYIKPTASETVARVVLPAPRPSLFKRGSGYVIGFKIRFTSI
jgi:hypothetical protein